MKVPQIVKILNSKSAEGISIASVTLELVAVASTLAYGYANDFPFRSVMFVGDYIVDKINVLKGFYLQNVF